MPYPRLAELADLESLGLTHQALSGMADDVKTRALDSASSEVLGYMRAAGYALPLVTWDDATRQHTCNIAAYRLLAREGFDPEKGADYIIHKGYTEAVVWLKQVASGAVVPDIVDSPPPGGGTTPGGGTSGSGAAGTGPIVLQARQDDSGLYFSAPQPRRWPRG